MNHIRDLTTKSIKMILMTGVYIIDVYSKKSVSYDNIRSTIVVSMEAIGTNPGSNLYSSTVVAFGKSCGNNSGGTT